MRVLTPQMKQLMAEPRYWDGDAPGHDDAVRKVSAAFAREPGAAQETDMPAWTAPTDPKLYSQRFANPESDALFQREFRDLLPREGGYTVNAGDERGPTNRGITQMTLDGINRDHPAWKLPKTTKELTEAQTEFIYREKFFYQPAYDRVAQIPGMRDAAPNLISLLFDMSAQHGPKGTGEIVQELLRSLTPAEPSDPARPVAKLDGILGQETRKDIARAVQAGHIGELYDRLAQRRGAILGRLAEEKNQPGQLPRARHFIEIGPAGPKR